MATKLKIPEPCHENWNEMTPIQSDCRHCAACDRQIVDFSKKTDAEVLRYLQQNSGKICGRFSALQLERPLMAPRVAKRGGLTAVAASFAAVLAAQQPAGNQPAEPVQTEQTPDFDRDVMGKVQHYNYLEAEDSMRTISGRILDELGEPLAGVTIVFPNSMFGAYTDVGGNFILKIPEDTLHTLALEIRLQYAGYETKIIPLPKRVLLEDLALLPKETAMTPDLTPAEPPIFMGVLVYDGFDIDLDKTPKPGLKTKVRQLVHKLFD